MSYNSKYTGQQVENLLDQVVNSITVETDPIFSESPAAKITDDNISAWNNKVDKVDGKQLSTEDFTTVLKNKLNGLSNYDDTTITAAVNKLRTDFDTLVSGDTTTAIKSFNEIVAFLDGISDSADLESIIASIEQQIAAKQDKITDLDTIRSGAAKGTTALQSYTETDPVFSKSAAAGITSSDISNWNGKTSNTGTVTGVKINGTTKSPTNGVVDLGAVITSHQDISGKVDKVIGKGLSTNDYTTDEKNKLASIAAGAEVNVQSDWNATSGDAFIKNKPSLSKVATSGSYNDLSNKPTIPSAITVDSSLSSTSTNPVQNKVINNALANKGTYSKPSGGIPKSDLTSAVQTSLGKADTALQSTSIAASAQKLVKSDGTTKVHVGSNGYVTIGGGTYSDFPLTVQGYTLIQNGSNVPLQLHSTSHASLGLMFKNKDNNQGYILYNGGENWAVTNNGWTKSYAIVHAGNVSNYLSSSSDATKKDVIGDVELDVSQIANAPVVRFTWKEGDDKEHVGTIAQYWQKVLPEVVIGEEGNLKMDYASLGVVNSIVLAKKVEEQEAVINDLRNEIAELKKRL